MPIRPLPVPYKIGVDICSISRVRNLITRESLVGKRAIRSTLTIDANQDEIPERKQHFQKIVSLDVQTNAHLEAMNTHLHPRLLAKLFRPEEIVTLRRYYDERAGSANHHRLFDYIAGR